MWRVVTDQLLSINPLTRRFRTAQLQDMVLHEQQTNASYKSERLPRTELSVDPPLFAKHDSYLCEDSSDSNSDSQL